MGQLGGPIKEGGAIIQHSTTEPGLMINVYLELVWNVLSTYGIRGGGFYPVGAIFWHWRGNSGVGLPASLLMWINRLPQLMSCSPHTPLLRFFHWDIWRLLCRFVGMAVIVFADFPGQQPYRLPKVTWATYEQASCIVGFFWLKKQCLSCKENTVKLHKTTKNTNHRYPYSGKVFWPKKIGSVKGACLAWE